MNVFHKMVNALYRDRHSVTMTITVPSQMFMALETLIYLRNEEPTKKPVDRDFIVGIALSHYLTEHLTKNEEKIADIPPAPVRTRAPQPQYAPGRMQARTSDYRDAQHS